MVGRLNSVKVAKAKVGKIDAYSLFDRFVAELDKRGLSKNESNFC
jgi:hypothetical protein